MPTFERDDIQIYYEEYGQGFPVWLMALGGMRSAISFWEGTPWNPIEQLAPNDRVIAMDQHNAGWLYDPQAPQIVFYYIAALFAVSAVVLMLIPLRQPGDRADA